MKLLSRRVSELQNRFIMESPRKLKLFVWKLRVDLVAATTIVKSNTKIIAKFSLVLADNTTQGQQPQTQAGRFRLRKQHGQTLQERLSNLRPQRISRLGLTKSWLAWLVFVIIPLQAGGQTQNLQTSLPTRTSMT